MHLSAVFRFYCHIHKKTTSCKQVLKATKLCSWLHSMFGLCRPSACVATLSSSSPSRWRHRTTQRSSVWRWRLGVRVSTTAAFCSTRPTLLRTTPAPSLVRNSTAKYLRILVIFSYISLLLFLFQVSWTRLVLFLVRLVFIALPLARSWTKLISGFTS